MILLKVWRKIETYSMSPVLSAGLWTTNPISLNLNTEMKKFMFPFEELRLVQFNQKH